MNLSLLHIAKTVKARVFLKGNNPNIHRVFIDSRSNVVDSASLFIALKGKRNNGHDYIAALYERGVRNFMVAEQPDLTLNANFIVVGDTLKALQLLATEYRKSFDLKIVSITGSNGKTTVKDWLYYLLAPDFNLVKSPKSYNSQVGVPLSLFEINSSHELGIFEAGISLKNEMKPLEKMICPDIGVLTNIGTAHAEGFDSKEQKLKEKIQLFDNAKIIVVPEEDFILNQLRDKNVISWGKSDKATIRYQSNVTSKNNTEISCRFGEKTYQFTIPFSDESAIENSLSCFAICVALKLDLDPILPRFASLFQLAMRLEQKRGINNCDLINDSYSSDLNSLKIALDFLQQQKRKDTATLILSTMEELGMSKENLVSKIADLVSKNEIFRFIGIGEMFDGYHDKFSNATFYKSTQEALKELDFGSFRDEAILLKGARSFQFEKISRKLELQTHDTVLEVNLASLVHNLNYFKGLVKESTKIMVMLKAFGYGSGPTELAKLLSFHGVDYLGVAYTDEGIQLREAGVSLPIMVMNPDFNALDQLLTYNLEPEIYNFRILERFTEVLEANATENYPIHIMLDTGMHRLGFDKKDLLKLVEHLSENKRLKVASVLSHLATSDAADKSFAREQIENFKLNSDTLLAGLKDKPLRHILNTSGIINFSENQFDMVRLGIGLYGISNTTYADRSLEVTGTLKSVISQKKTIEKGESVGYGRGFIATTTTTIATIPIGYADGMDRRFGNGIGFVIIHGKKAPILGSVCMDMLMVDSTGISCEEGDEVVLFGEYPKVTELATSIGTIPYEILTNISSRVKRVFYWE